MSARARKILAFDYGTKKIGVAFGQSITGSGTALAPLITPQQRVDWQAIATLISDWQPDSLLVGLPLNMDGSESPMSQRAQRFGRRLHGRFHLPIMFIDERLSTRAARERLGKPALTGKDSRVDSVAAVIMIETYYRHEGTCRELEH